MNKPAHYAAACVGEAPLKLLLEGGVDARDVNKNKETPIMIAAKYGRVHNLRLLIEA